MALVITTSQRVKVKISKKSKTDQTTKNLGLKKRGCIRIQHLLFLLFFGIPVRGRHKPTTAQAHPSTEHGWKNPAILGQPPENQTLCFAFAETSNWNTIFFHITRHFLTTCWICLIWMYLLAMGSLYFSNKGFTLNSSVSSFHRRDLGLAQNRPIHPIHLGSFAGSPNFWTQITVFSNENLPQSIWQNHNRILQS